MWSRNNARNTIVLLVFMAFTVMLAACSDPLRDLSSPDAEKRAYAARMVGESGNLEAINKLVFLLEDHNPKVAQAAEVALGKMGAPGAPVLLNHLRNTLDQNVRERLVRVLIAIGPGGAGAVARSLDLPAEKDMEVIYKIVSSYPSSSIPEFLRELDGASLLRRKQISQILIRLDMPVVDPICRAAGPVQKTFQQDLAFILLKIGRPAMLRLTDYLVSTDPALREGAMNLLPQIVTAFPDDAFYILSSENRMKAKQMAKLLMGAGENAKPILLDALLTQNQEVRTYALNALLEMGWQAETLLEKTKLKYAKGQSEEALRVLENMMGSDVDRAAARKSLKHIGTPACSVFSKLMENGDSLLRSDALVLSHQCDCPEVNQNAFSHFWYDRSSLVRAKAMDIVAQRGQSVSAYLNGLSEAARNDIFSHAKKNADLATMSLLTDTKSGSKYANAFEALAKKAKKDFLADRSDVDLDRVRERKVTVVARGQVATGISVGKFMDVGGPYEMDLDRIEGTGTVMMYLENVEIRKHEKDSPEAYYRYHLAFLPRYMTPLGIHTLRGRISIYHVTEQGRHLVANHTFTQDVEVKDAGTLEPSDVYVYYLEAWNMMKKLATSTDVDQGIYTQKRPLYEAALARNRLMLKDLANMADPEISGRAIICLELLKSKEITG